MPVPAMLLDSAERTNVSAGQAEHGLRALDWPIWCQGGYKQLPEQALLLMLGHHLSSGDSGEPLHLVRAEHQAVLLQLCL